MSSARLGVALLLAAALVLPRSRAAAQQYAQSATVSMSLRVLPQASLEGGPERRLSAAVVPGEPLQVDPAIGVHTRLTLTAATQVVVSGAPLRGPGGAVVQVRFVCAFGSATAVSAAEPFDCIGGLLAELDGGRMTTIPLHIGAELSGRESLAVPPGRYAGLVTLTATLSAY